MFNDIVMYTIMLYHHVLLIYIYIHTNDTNTYSTEYYSKNATILPLANYGSNVTANPKQTPFSCFPQSSGAFKQSVSYSTRRVA